MVENPHKDYIVFLENKLKNLQRSFKYRYGLVPCENLEKRNKQFELYYKIKELEKQIEQLKNS